MKNCTLLFSAIAVFFTLTVKAQTISTIENLTLQTDTFWNGSDLSGSFASGNVIYPNFYDTSFGGYWATGWAYSNMTDTATVPSDFSTQLYVGKAGSGYQSSNYAIGQQGALTKLTGAALGGVVNGVYVTNSDYAYNSMFFGDAFAKQFGGPTGNDPDWFKLVIRKYYQGVMTNDSVEFYLADYRFSNNSMDYLVRNWTWVDLTSLGNVDSLAFFLSSTDNGSWGMNTPAFFCIDNLTTADSPLGIVENNSVNFTLYPIPATEYLHLKGDDLTGAQMTIYTMTGQKIQETILTSDNETVSLISLAPGLYNFVLISKDGSVLIRKPFVHE